MTKPHETAFPITCDQPGFSGMTKREFFAALAMQGFLSNGPTIEAVSMQVAEGDRSELIATSSVDMANALIAALNNP